MCTVRSSACTTNACSPGAVASNTAEKVPSLSGVAGTPFTVTSADGNDGVTCSVAVSPVNRTYRSHSARTNRVRCAAWTKKSSLPSHGKITQEIVACSPGCSASGAGCRMKHPRSLLSRATSRSMLYAARLPSVSTRPRCGAAPPIRSARTKLEVPPQNTCALQRCVSCSPPRSYRSSRGSVMPMSPTDVNTGDGPTFVMTTCVRTASPSRTVDTVASRSPAASFECRDERRTSAYG